MCIRDSYWRNEAGDKDENRPGFDHQRKKRILRNKYVNNGKLGYYATVSCFNGGSVKLITDAQDLQHLHAVKEQAAEIKTLNELFMEPVSYTHLDVYKRQGLGDRPTALTCGRRSLCRDSFLVSCLEKST